MGLPTADGPGVVLKSAASFAQATWLHLRIDVIVNTNGNVVLKVFQNDLALHPLGTPPDWQPVSVMVEFIDDHLGINAGSPPLTSGRGGFGFLREGRDALRVLRPPRAVPAGVSR